MENRTAIKIFCTTIAFFIYNLSYAQSNGDFYSLFKGGKKYKKIVGYVMLNNSSKKTNKNKNIRLYNVNQITLEHRKKDHEESICSILDIKNLKKSTLKELGLAEENELNLRLQEEGIKKYPRPINHRILKIYLLEPINDGKNFRKTEVEWLYYLK